MNKVLYAHIPGLFVGNREQFEETFGYIGEFEYIVNWINEETLDFAGEVTFKWLAPDEVEAWVQSRD